jgi:hypothetical protein
MTELAFALLKSFYPPEGVYLKELSDFSIATSSMTGTFCIPQDAAYSIFPLNYVTGEQYVRCISQLSYGLLYLLSIDRDDIKLFGNSEDFKSLMYSGKMWYRRMDLKFIHQVLKGEDFNLRMEVTSIQKRGRGNLVVASLRATGPVFVQCEFAVPC